MLLRRSQNRRSLAPPRPSRSPRYFYCSSIRRLTANDTCSRLSLSCSRAELKETAVARQQEIKLTRFELEMMDALWKLGSASVREIQEALPEKKRPAYTTVQTIIRRL